MEVCIASPGKVIIAPIYSGVVAEGLRWRLPTLGPTARLEPEVAVTLVRDLPPRNIPYEEAEVVNSVGSVRLALELLDCRYVSPERVSFEELLADGLFNAGLFLGPEVDGGLARDFGRTQISLEVDGASVQSLEGRHPDGNPVIPLHWLVNKLRERGAGLERGQVVITGSYAGVIEVPANANLRIGFGGLGRSRFNCHRRKSMRLVRYGERGRERPGALDAQGTLRDLSGVVRDIDGAALMPKSLDRLRGLDLGSCRRCKDRCGWARASVMCGTSFASD